MPRRLHRYYGSGYLHFITSSCYQRRPLLNTPRRRTWFLEILEQLRYMHRNPVKRGLALEPEQWAWSSFRYYAYGERGAVLVNEQRPAQLRVRDPEEFVA